MSIGATALATSMTLAHWAKLLLLGAIWGGSFFFARISVVEMHPLTLVLFRVAIAALALHLYLAARGLSFRPVLDRWPAFLLLGAINNVIPFSLIFFGQREMGAGLASVLNATTPFWTIAIGTLLATGEKLTWNRIVGILLGIAGTAVMVGPGLVAGLGGPVWPKLLLIGASLSYAFALIFSRRFRDLPPVLVAVGQLSFSTLIMLPVVLAWSGSARLFDFSPHVWAAVIALALLSTAFAYILYFDLVSSAGATNASLVTLIVPVSALLLGATFLGEKLDSFEMAGMTLIGLGLITIDGRVFRRR